MHVVGYTKSKTGLELLVYSSYNLHDYYSTFGGIRSSKWFKTHLPRYYLKTDLCTDTRRTRNLLITLGLITVVNPGSVGVHFLTTSKLTINASHYIKAMKEWNAVVTYQLFGKRRRRNRTLLVVG